MNDEEPYLRSVVFHQWLFGYELPDTIVLIREDGHIWICATKKKCEFVRPAVDKGGDDFVIHLLLRNKEDSNLENYKTLLAQATSTANGENGAAENGLSAPKVGVFVKERGANRDSNFRG